MRDIFSVLLVRKNLFAVDINCNGVKILSLNSKKITFMAENQLKIDNCNSVSQYVSELFDNIRNPKVISALPSAFTQHYLVDSHNEDKIRRYIELEMKRTFNEDVIFDFHRNIRKNIEKEDILVVAVKRQQIEEFQENFSEFDCKLMVLDVRYFALQNCFEKNYPEYFYKTVAIVEILNNVVLYNICRRGESLECGEFVLENGSSIGEEIIQDNNLFEQTMASLRNVIQGKIINLWHVSSIFFVASEEVVSLIQQDINVQCKSLNPFRKIFYNPNTGIKQKHTWSAVVGMALRG